MKSLLSQSPPPPQPWRSHLSSLGVAGEKGVVPATFPSCTARVARHSYSQLPFFPRENSPPGWISFPSPNSHTYSLPTPPHTVFPCEGWENWESFSYPRLHSNQTFFSRIVCWNLFLGNCTFANSLSYMNIYPGQHSPGFFLAVLIKVWVSLLAPQFHSPYQRLSAYY